MARRLIPAYVSKPAWEVLAAYADFRASGNPIVLKDAMRDLRAEEALADVLSWQAVEEALADVLSWQAILHPLPWRIESDWTEEVVASDGYVVAKCRERETAEFILALAVAA